MSVFYAFEGFGEFGVEVVDFGWPVFASVGFGVVSDAAMDETNVKVTDGI